MIGPRPIRIAHLADTHIGMENYGRVNPQTGLNQRLHDFLNSLDQALDGALAAKVDVVVFAGDVYKTRDPTPTHQREFARRIHRLAQAGIKVMIVAGNHDIPLSVGRASSIERVDFGEQGEDKGWVYLEIAEKGKAEWDFRKVAARSFVTIEATVESD